MLILAYTYESRRAYMEDHEEDQDDELTRHARAVWGHPHCLPNRSYQYKTGFLSNVNHEDTWFWVATAPEAELWLSLNASPGYEIWDSLPNHQEPLC